MAATGDVHRALTIAIAVLIITCPCALGLAVPMVQVVAARRLFEQGIMVKDGGALERLAEVDIVVFDKTGTLTRGEPQLVDGDAVDPDIAGAGCRDRIAFPPSLFARAERRRPGTSRRADRAGLGVRASRFGTGSIDRRDRVSARPTRMGACRAVSCGNRDRRPQVSSCRRMANVWQRSALRTGFARTLARRLQTLAEQGLAMEVLSGDREEPVRQLASALGVSHHSQVSPGGKAAHIASIARSGRKVLMVGDGLNDAPALVASHASMAPASAADVGRNAADLVFLRDSLLAVPQAIAVARNARRLVRENLAIAVGYNAIAMPIAILGYVTPLIAAVAMSLSSLIVVANALRLGRGRRKKLSNDNSRKSRSPSTQFALERQMTDFFYLIPSHWPWARWASPRSCGRSKAASMKTWRARRNVFYSMKVTSL